MKTISYQIANNHNTVTTVENCFITEVMPYSNGDYVKIYLFGLSAVQHPKTRPLSNEEIARLLDIPESKVIEAYQYWQDEGIVKIHDEAGNMTITFLNVADALKERRRVRTDQNIFPVKYQNDKKFTQLIRKVETMMGGAVLPLRFIESIIFWLEDYQFDYECICFLLDYSLSMMDQDDFFSINGKLNYFNKVADNWSAHHVRTMQDAMYYTDEFKSNKKNLSRILNELGIFRAPIRYEKDLYNKWLHEFNYDMNIIMEGVRRTTVPNLNYLDKILTSWHINNYETLEQVQNAPKGRGKNQQNQNFSENFENDESYIAAQHIENKLFETFRKKRLANKS